MTVRNILGPLDPYFHQDVGAFLKTEPPGVNKECLRDFFQRLRTAPVEVSCEQFHDGGIMYAATCGCIIVFYDHGNLVRNIYPAP